MVGTQRGLCTESLVRGVEGDVLLTRRLLSFETFSVIRERRDAVCVTHFQTNLARRRDTGTRCRSGAGSRPSWNELVGSTQRTGRGPQVPPLRTPSLNPL